MSGSIWNQIGTGDNNGYYKDKSEAGGKCSLTSLDLYITASPLQQCIHIYTPSQSLFFLFEPMFNPYSPHRVPS